MTEREMFEKWISTRKLCKKYGAKLDLLPDGLHRDVRVRGHFSTWQAARAASPKVPQVVEDAYQALQNELIQIQATIESFATPAAALSALIDWHVAVATDPRVNGGRALVPVEVVAHYDALQFLIEPLKKAKLKGMTPQEACAALTTWDKARNIASAKETQCQS